MDHLYWLHQIQLSHHPLVGDKAFYLSQLMQRSYPVIPGFVVSTQALQEFLETIHWLEPLFADLPGSSLHLNVYNPRQLREVAQQIRQAIAATPLSVEWSLQLEATTAALVSTWVDLTPPVLILRPSLTLQLPKKTGGSQFGSTSHLNGLLESRVCWAEPTAIATALKEVWAELFRAKSLLYWQASGIQLQQVNLAVLVQPVYPAIAAGSLQVRSNQFQIYSTYGLGVALTQGDVQPDYYQVQAASGIVQAKTLGSKTIAYNPTPQGKPLDKLTNGCLKAYLTEAEQQNQFSLEETDLQALVMLAQTLMVELGDSLCLEWLLRSAIADARPQLYLTQIGTYHPAAAPSSRFASRSAPHLSTPQPTALSLLDLSPTPVGNQAASYPLVSQTNPLPTNASPEQPLEQQPLSATTSTLSTPQPAANVDLTDSMLVVSGLAAASGRIIAPAYVVEQTELDLSAIASGHIVIAPFIAPDWLPLLKRSVGVVAEQGGMTCHAAIVARELGIPATVNATRATQLIQTGDLLLLDGTQGKVYRLSGESLLSGGSLPDLPTPTHAPLSNGLTQPPIATRLMVNLSQVSSLDRISPLAIDGVGLLRSEFMLLESLDHQHPNLWIQQGRQAELSDRLANQIRQFAQAFAPRPVFYRSLDLRSHELKTLQGNETAELNPMLGLRGTFRYMLNPDLFDLELTALAQVQQAGFTNVQLMLPFVRGVEEFVFCRQRVEQIGLTRHSQFQLWIMAEVPSVIFLLPEFVAAGVQGISIGTNDLTQLILGVDRDQGDLAQMFDARHPAVLRAIAQLIQTARQLGIPCSICGQAPAQYPELIDSLIQAGITSISVDPTALQQTYTAIARAERRVLLEKTHHHS